jgi:hypothetical protein
MDSGTTGLLFLKLSLKINCFLLELYEYLQTERQSRFNRHSVGMRTPFKVNRWLVMEMWAHVLCSFPHKEDVGQRTVEGGRILDMNTGNEGLSPRGDQPLSQTGDSRNYVTSSLYVWPLSVVTAKPCLFMLRWSNDAGISRVLKYVYEHVNYFEWNKMRCVMIGTN